MIQMEQERLDWFVQEMYSANYTRTYQRDVPYNGIVAGSKKRVQDNQKILDLLDLMYQEKVMVRGDFFDLVLRIIVFHQSFFGLPHIPPFSELNIGRVHFGKANGQARF